MGYKLLHPHIRFLCVTERASLLIYSITVSVRCWALLLLSSLSPGDCIRFAFASASVTANLSYLTWNIDSESTKRFSTANNVHRARSHTHTHIHTHFLHDAKVMIQIMLLWPYSAFPFIRFNHLLGSCPSLSWAEHYVCVWETGNHTGTTFEPLDTGTGHKAVMSQTCYSLRVTDSSAHHRLDRSNIIHCLCTCCRNFFLPWCMS